MIKKGRKKISVLRKENNFTWDIKRDSSKKQGIIRIELNQKFHMKRENEKSSAEEILKQSIKIKAPRKKKFWW